MLFVLSPAKTLDYQSPAAAIAPTLPRSMNDAAKLVRRLRRLDIDALGDLMDISPKLAELNRSRFKDWKSKDFESRSRAAIFAFDGDVYEGLRARSMQPEALHWAQDHVRILSGLYGVLRPFDLLQPYRLEMGTRLENERGRDLYAFWGDRIARSLDEDVRHHAVRLVVNLASEEYFAAVDMQRLRAPVLRAVFQESRGGPFRIVSFSAKKARGMMARWAVEQRIEDPENLKYFAEEGYRYCPASSERQTWVFRRSLSDIEASEPR